MGRRFFRHGELPLVLVALLADRPMNGYELMAELGRLFAPHYRASPGSVYPATEALEAEGLIAARGDGPRVYTVTASGRKALEKRRDVLAALELRTGVHVAQKATVDAALDRFAARVRALAGWVDPDMLERLLKQSLDDIEQEAAVSGALHKEARA